MVPTRAGGLNLREIFAAAAAPFPIITWGEPDHVAQAQFLEGTEKLRAGETPGRPESPPECWPGPMRPAAWKKPSSKAFCDSCKVAIFGKQRTEQARCDRAKAPRL